MADNLSIQTGAGGPVRTDDIGGIHYQIVKIAVGADGSVTLVSDAAPLPVDDAGGSLTVDDGGSSLTTDNPILSVVGGGTEAAAQRVTIANNSTGVLTVDGEVTANLQFAIVKISAATVSASPGASYTAGDVVGTELEVGTGATSGALLKHITIGVEGAHTGTLDMSVILFDTQPANIPGDDFSYSIGNDAADAIGLVKFTEAGNFNIAGAGGSVGSVNNIDIHVGSGTIYAVIIADAVFDPGADKLGIKFGFQID